MYPRFSTYIIIAPMVAFVLLLVFGCVAERDERSQALIQAALKDDRDVVKRMLQAGADVNFRDPDGVTALMKAAFAGHVDMVRLLLDNGADVNMQVTQVKYGNTALMDASMMGRVEVVKLLIDRGADIDAQDEWYGDTPLILSVIMEHVEVAALLFKAGAKVHIADVYERTALDWAIKKGEEEIEHLLRKQGSS